jgi:hypothetical protein
MFFSLVPGFGQFYNGQLVKGVVILGIVTLAMALIALSGSGSGLMRAIALAFNPNAPGNAAPPSPIAWFALLVLVGTWLYSVVDAPFQAGKAREAAPRNPNLPPVPGDKSGWDV